MNLKFEKWSGAGNDFLVVDFRDTEVAQAFSTWSGPRSEFARAVCRRTQSVGADGLIFLTTVSGQMTWEFYNADGSEAEMCGNAARCVGSYELRRTGHKAVTVATKAGVVWASFVGDGRVSVAMSSARAINEDHRIHISNGEAPLTGVWIDSGVPHYVVRLPEIRQLPSREFSARIRRHVDFGPAGTNVTYVVTAEREVEAVTFERGVEDYTQACGTGAVAAAFALNVWDRTPERTRTVRMPGGVLEVSWAEGATVLTGPAKRICLGQITEEAL